MNLDQLLIKLARYGKPTLFQMDDGTWTCMVNVRFVLQGVDFKVKGRDSTPHLATLAAYDNLARAIEKLNEGMPDVTSLPAN